MAFKGGVIKNKDGEGFERSKVSDATQITKEHQSKRKKERKNGCKEMTRNGR
jgi:hypothetical protein